MRALVKVLDSDNVVTFLNLQDNQVSCAMDTVQAVVRDGTGNLAKGMAQRYDSIALGLQMLRWLTTGACGRWTGARKSPEEQSFLGVIELVSALSKFSSSVCIPVRTSGQAPLQLGHARIC